MLKGLIGCVSLLLLFPAPAFAQASYGNCPDPYAACQLYHPGSVPTAWCGYQQCFEVSDGDYTRVVAEAEQGPFPTGWKIWLPPDRSSFYGLSCHVTLQGKKKVEVDIPDDGVRCALRFSIGPTTYAEHFASNPLSGCLAWLECKLP